VASVALVCALLLKKASHQTRQKILSRAKEAKKYFSRAKEAKKYFWKNPKNV
jgi:hypothetical protein